MSTTPPYEKVTWRGHKFDQRTKSAIKWVEQHYIAVAPKKRSALRIGQGSYSDGSLSAGTHSGGGAVDIMFAGLNEKQQRSVVKWMRRAGFAAWGRTGRGWEGNEHAHGILIGHKNLHPAAQAQVVAYKNRRDGLVSNNVDNTWRPRYWRRWNHRLNKPILKK